MLFSEKLYASFSQESVFFMFVTFQQNPFYLEILKLHNLPENSCFTLFCRKRWLQESYPCMWFPIWRLSYLYKLSGPLDPFGFNLCIGFVMKAEKLNPLWVFGGILLKSSKGKLSYWLKAENTALPMSVHIRISSRGGVEAKGDWWVWICVRCWSD